MKLVGVARAIAISTAVLVGAAGALVVMPNGSASADDNALILPGGASSVTLGPNAVLRVDGRLRYFRNCTELGVNDFVYPATDVYIVDSDFDPTTGPINQKLVDASGTPNTIVQGGTAFIEQLIAITAPAGTLGAGTYSIVYDTCQDGSFQRSQGDEIFRNVLTVEFPPIIPPIDASVAALKNSAYGEWGRWQEIGKLFDTLLNVESVAKCAGLEVSECLPLIKIWVTSPTIQKWIEAYENVSAQSACVGGEISACFGILSEYWGFKSQSPRSIVTGGAKSLIANQAKSFFGVYADPPRSDFGTPSSATLTLPVPTVRGESPIIDSLSEFNSALERQQALWDALLAAIERYQGAQSAGDAVAALAQARTAAGIAVALRSARPITNDRLQTFATTVEAEIPGFDAVAANRLDDLIRIQRLGFTREEDQALRNAGIAGPDRVAYLQTLADSRNGAISRTALQDLQVRVAGLGAANDVDAALADLISGVDDLELAITGINRSDVPTVTLPTRLTASVGAPVSFTATASTGAELAWDLDADGAFDDATGSVATPTFAVAGSRVVAVSATDAGITVVAHALVEVAATNAPPVITNAAPGLSASGVVGQPTTFVVTAADPTGETLTYEWFVDGEYVVGAAGPSLTLIPAARDRGKRIVNVTVSDRHPGNLAASTWRWQVVDVDADGDGWSANRYADCDDTNGDIHPGRPEQLFNGVDDDCDPATPDRPLELTSGQLFGWGFYPESTGTGVPSATPRYAGIDHVAQAVATWRSGAVLDDRGFVWGWGYGALAGGGDAFPGTVTTRPAPVLAPGGTGQLGGVSRLVASFEWFGARTADGRALTWGQQNGFGKLGQGNTNAAQPYAPIPGYVVGADLQPITGVRTVEAGYRNGYLILDDGTAMVWGERICNPPNGLTTTEFAVPAPNLGTGIVQIDGGTSSVLLRYGDGSIGVCEDSSRAIVRFGPADFGGQRVADIETINNALGSFVLTEDGTIWVKGVVAGNDSFTGLITDAPINRTTYVRVVLPPASRIVELDGAIITCATFARREDGSAFSFGYNQRNCDAQGSNRVSAGGLAVLPGPVDFAGQVAQISAALEGGVAVVRRNGGDVWSWGHATGAGRGGDLTSPAPIPSLTNVVEVQTWFRHGYALRADGSVWGWGLNDSNAGGFAGAAGPVRGPGGVGNLTGVVDLTEGDSSMYALRADGTVLSWGYENTGSLGSGAAPVVARSAPDTVRDSADRALSGIDRVFQMGDAGLAQHADGTMFQWGARKCTGAAAASSVSDAAVIETGLPANVVQATGSPGDVAIFRLADGSVMACGADRPDAALPPADYVAHPLGSFGPGDPALDVDTRGIEWWVVTASGQVWVKTWDASILAQSGGAAGVLHRFALPAGSSVVDVEADASEVQLRRADGTLLTFGANTNGATGRPAPANPQVPGQAVIGGFVIGSSADAWHGLALVLPNGLMDGSGWVPPQRDIAVSAEGTSGPEGGTATAAVTLNRMAGVDLTVSWQFAGATGTTLVPAGETSAPVPLSLPARDGVWGVNRTVPIELTAVSNGAVLANEVAEIEVRDADPVPTLSVVVPPTAEGNGVLTPYSVPVRMSAPAGVDVRASVTSTDGSAAAGTDYAPVDLEVVFPAGSTEQTVPLVVLGNTVAQPDRAFSIAASSPTLGGQGGSGAMLVTILDDDPVAVLARGVRVAAGSTATVTLSAPGLPAGETVTVNWATADLSATAPADYTAAAGTVVLSPTQSAVIEVQTVAPSGTGTGGAAALVEAEVRSLSVSLVSSSESRLVLAPSSAVVGINRAAQVSPVTTTGPPATPLPTTSTSVPAVPSSPPVLTPTGTLPETGGQLQVWVVLAGLLVVAGLVARRGSRRRGCPPTQ